MNYYVKFALIQLFVTLVSFGAAWSLARLFRRKRKTVPEVKLEIHPWPEPKTELCDFVTLCRDHSKNH